MQPGRSLSSSRSRLCSASLLCLCAVPALAEGAQSTPSILAPASTPAHEIYGLSLFVLLITGSIFAVVGGLLAYVIIKFRAREPDAEHEPPQIYGSAQVELAWTVIPVLIVVVLFLTTARIIFAIQDAPEAQISARCHRHRPPVLVGVPLSQAEYRHRQRAAYSREHARSIPSQPICACSRPTSITASGCRSSPAKPI